jgi:hypothetical protein
MDQDVQIAEIHYDNDGAGGRLLHPFNEDTLLMLKNNDPSVIGLHIEEDTTIKGAGRIIAESKLLRRMDIDVGTNEMTRRGEFWCGLACNRSIESLFLASTCVKSDVEEIMRVITPFFEANDNLQCIDYKIREPEALSSLSNTLANYNNDSLKRIHIYSVCGIDQLQAEFFDSLKEMHSLMELSCGGFDMGRMGCFALANLLRNLASNITTLILDDTEIDDEGIAVLTGAFIVNSANGTRNSLRTLCITGEINFTGTGWIVFSSFISHPMCLLENLRIETFEIYDRELICLGAALIFNQSVKHLDLSESLFDISTRGWKEFSMCLRSHHSALEELNLWGCEVTNDGAIEIVTALAENSRLTTLHLSPRGSSFSEQVWQYLECLLCDTTSIEGTFFSNHTLHTLDLGARIENAHSSNVLSLLEMNRGVNKSEVARQKIMAHHFSGDTTNLHMFVHMQEAMLPFALEWIGMNNLGFSLMFSLVQELVPLVDIRNVV